MTKREYVIQTLNHQRTDKVPYCIRLTPEVYEAYGKRILEDFYNKDVQDDLNNEKITFIQAIDLSIGNYMIDIGAPWWDWDYKNMPEIYADPYEEPDVMPPIIRMDSDKNMKEFYENAKYIAEKYQTFNVSLIWGSHWEKAYFTRGIENFLADLAGAPDFSKELLNYIVDYNMEILPKIAKCEYLDGILLGSDWGTQQDLLMSPVTWKEMIKPGEHRQYELIKAYGKKVMVHSCGQILRLLPELTELGVDILNPVQPECMDLKFLKDMYGDKITFWGGISTQRTLPYGTPEEVRRETREVIELMSKNGGYITCSSQEIQNDVPYENLKALIETAKEFA